VRMAGAVGLVLFFAAGNGRPEGAARSSRLYAGRTSSNLAVTGVIQGQVVFQGKDIPKPSQVENTTDPEYCGTQHSLEDFLVSPKTRGIKNVVVALAAGSFPPAPEGAAANQKQTLNNRNCRFEPHVAVLQTGGSVEAVNADKIFHTTHLYYGPLSKNLGLGIGEKASQAANRPGFIIVKCDIHGWMKAFIRVDDHPFHAVSDADGRFEIRGVPEGTYTLEIWHERLGEQKMNINVKAGVPEMLTIGYGK